MGKKKSAKEILQSKGTLFFLLSVIFPSQRHATQWINRNSYWFLDCTVARKFWEFFTNYGMQWIMDLL